jgi:hypothetical protein
MGTVPLSLSGVFSEEAEHEVIDLIRPLEREEVAGVLEDSDTDSRCKPPTDTLDDIDPDAAVPGTVEIEDWDLPTRDRVLAIRVCARLARPSRRLAVVTDRGSEVPCRP